MFGNPVVMSIFIGLITSVSARSPYKCKPCTGDVCDTEPTGCLYGLVKDPCGRWMCASGPGETCGGSIGLFGKCGAGLSCNTCGRCTGCSKERIALGIRECFTDISEC